MRIASFFAVLIFYTASLLGQVIPASQDTTGIIQTDTTAVVPSYMPEEPFHAPDPSSLAELLYRTQQGEFDPVRVIGEMADQGSGVVDSLRKILLEELEVTRLKALEASVTESESIQVPTGIDTLGLQRMRVYSLLILEAMNKREAYTLLTEVAATHVDSELRGIALNALSTSMHEHMTKETPSPTTELIYLFLLNADDTTHVKFHSATIGEIARQGLKTWTGRDFGAISDFAWTIRVGEEKSDMTIQQYRELWWEQNKGKMVWNVERKEFEVE